MQIDYLKVNAILQYIFKPTVVLYFLFSLVYFFIFSKSGNGDEALFISDLQFIEKNGWINSIEKGISIPYMLLTYPFSNFFQYFVALRLVNFVLLSILFYYFFKVVAVKSKEFYCYLMFYLATSSIFFKGTNDALFFLGLIIFLTEVYYYLEFKKMNSEVMAFSGLVLAFFTRELFVIYIPIILLGFFFLYKNGIVFRVKSLTVPSLLLLCLLIGNIPSLTLHKKLSFDTKIPPTTVSVDWSQRQYLAQMLVNNGSLDNFQHPSWEETQEYVDKNGANSLPRGIISGLTFEYSLTVKEFFKDFYYSLFYGFRQLGFILLFPFYFIIRNFKKGNFLNPELFVPYSMFIMLAIFSLIIISFVELRWLTAIFITAIVFYGNCQDQKRINLKIVLVNYFIIICFSIVGLYGLIGRLDQV